LKGKNELKIKFGLFLLRFSAPEHDEFLAERGARQIEQRRKADGVQAAFQLQGYLLDLDAACDARGAMFRIKVYWCNKVASKQSSSSTEQL